MKFTRFNLSYFMDFKDQIKQLAERVNRLKDSIQTEEATKTAFIMPFLNTLGYDVFNPLEVVPEFISDIGTKKGEKVDYAIMKEVPGSASEPCMLIECKHWKQPLTLHDNQLLRYFHVTKARFGILTNGITYRFYTDLEEPNKMDAKPFLEVDMLDLRENLIEELKKFHKSYFDVNLILNTASELKYTGLLKTLVQQDFANPSDTLTRYYAQQVYDGKLTAKVVENFAGLLKRSISQTISEQIADRLKTAFSQEQIEIEASTDAAIQVAEPEEKKGPVVVTTQDELEGFYIVRAILRPVVDIERVVYRDAQSYFAILLDDNNRKPICRLNFNGQKKYITLFGEAKAEIKQDIQSLNDIFSYADQLQKTVELYAGKAVE